MSIHSSLKSAGTMKRHRSVLSRLERVKLLQEKGELNLGEKSILGLPKVKHLKIRMRKEKAVAAAPGTAAAAAGESATVAPPVAAAGGKTAAKAAPTPKSPGAQAKPESGGPAKKKE